MLRQIPGTIEGMGFDPIIHQREIVHILAGVKHDERASVDCFLKIIPTCCITG
jgi:hypothetical protein